jgi:hypothetical protein
LIVEDIAKSIVNLHIFIQCIQFR